MMKTSKGPSGRERDAGFLPFGDAEQSECLSEAHLNLGLWQPDMCPHSLLPPEQMRALLSKKLPEQYLGTGELVFYCKTGAGN